MKIPEFLLQSQYLYIFLTLLAAAAGGLLFMRLRVPAGAMLGAMFFVMAMSIFWGKSMIPDFMITISKIIAGTLIGCRISRRSILLLKRVIVPITATGIMILVLSMATGFFIYGTSTLNKATALFGSAPGGVSDMSLISAEFGADMIKVALLQTIRIIVCMTAIPAVVRLVNRKRKTGKILLGQQKYSMEEIQCEEKLLFGKVRISKTMKFVLTLILGAAGGFAGYAASIPAGALTGAILLVALFNMCFFQLYIPQKFNIGTQMLIGGVIGLSMTRDDVASLKDMLLPAAIIAVFMILVGLVLGYLLSRIWKIDISTALISTAPGGISQMTLIAEELGADVSVVTAVHMFRLLAVLLFYPVVMNWII